jgi:hypothetical protein
MESYIKTLEQNLLDLYYSVSALISVIRIVLNFRNLVAYIRLANITYTFTAFLRILQCCGSGSGIEKNPDLGSGINIPFPDHKFEIFVSIRCLFDSGCDIRDGTIRIRVNIPDTHTLDFCLKIFILKFLMNKNQCCES